MPTYEYVCTACDNQWEEIQKISADSLEVCPKCSKSTAKRQISGGAFILKGGGWYADLYSSQPKAKSGGDSSSSSGSSTTAAPAKSDSSSASGGASSPAAAPAASSGSASGGSSGGSTSGSTSK